MKLLAQITLLALLLVKVNAGFSQGCGNNYLNATYDTVDIRLDVPFGKNKTFQGINQVLKADIYTGRHNNNRNRPAVLVLFGGSFVSGSKTTAGIPAFAQLLAQHGYVGIAIDYRIGLAGYNGTEMTKAVYRATQDALAAVRYFRANADTFGIDSSQIFASGFSAGAITCLHAAFWNMNELPPAINVSAMGTLDTASGTPGISGRISGVLNIAGGIGDTNWINPSENIPIGSFHNSSDPTVPYGYNTLPVVNLPIYGSSLVTDRQLHVGHKAWLKTLNVTGLHVPQMGTPESDTMARVMLANLYSMLACNNSPTGFNSQNATLEAWQMYPNPANGFVQIRNNPYLVSGHTLAELYNATGKLVTSISFESSDGLNQLNFPSVAAGLYTLRLQANGLAENKRLIIR